MFLVYLLRGGQIRRRGLVFGLSNRSACPDHDIHRDALKKILNHPTLRHPATAGQRAWPVELDQRECVTGCGNACPVRD